MSDAAGWYEDWKSENQERYWDGLKWTDRVRPLVAAKGKPPIDRPKRAGLPDQMTAWPQPGNVAQTVVEARNRWNRGHRMFVYRVQSPSSLLAGGVADALEQVEAIGWRLQTMSSHMNRIGFHTEVAVFVFRRD